MCTGELKKSERTLSTAGHQWMQFWIPFKTETFTPHSPSILNVTTSSILEQIQI